MFARRLTLENESQLCDNNTVNQTLQHARDAIAGIQRAASVQLIESFENKLAEVGHKSPDLPTIHSFTPGFYVRQVKMPAGTLWTTRIHKTEHPFVMSHGHVSVFVDGEWRSMKGYNVGVTTPGTKRAILVHEDTVWTTFHATDETDVDKLEELLVEPLTEIQRQVACNQKGALCLSDS